MRESLTMWWLFILLLYVLNCLGKNFNSELLHPEWQDIISAGGIHFGHGRSKRFVELNENQPNVPHQACLLPDGKPGHCRHLHYCVQEVFKSDFLKFMDYVCIIQYSSIGVCCPDALGEGAADAVAGDLPSTASKHENEIAIQITRAENRGCGLTTRVQGRASGSRLTNPREWPWMASIAPKGQEQYGAGVLITDRHVLTAAHCIRRVTVENLLVRLGEYDFKRTNDSRIYNFRVIEIRKHELFDRFNYHNDIAILKLHRAAVFNTYVWPICLPPRGLELDNEIVTVIGWGALKYRGELSNVLMELSIPVWEHQSCINSFSDTIFDENICAAGKDGKKDSCQGDSGGPLMYQLPSGRWTVVGIVSWGMRCGEAKHPGIYTRVDRYLEWILKNTIF